MQGKNGVYITIAVIAIAVIFLMSRQKSEPQTQSPASAPIVEEKAASQTETASSATTPQNEIQKVQQSQSSRIPSQQVGMGDRAYSQPKDNKRAHNKGPEAGEALQRTALFPESRWQRWPGVRAFAPQTAPADADVLAEVSGYTLTRDNGFPGSEKAFSNEEPLVYYDSRTRSAGVVTGEIRLVVADQQKLQQILNQYNLKVSTPLPDVNTYFVISNEAKFNLEELYSQLARESQVESVQVEILSRQYEKF
jgi:hypothetical protein